MDFKLEKVEPKDKEKLYRLLQFALYDGSQYIDNDTNKEYMTKNDGAEDIFVFNNSKR